MEYRQLQYFIEVAEAASFSRAAERLFISQPALSKQISDLEKEFGILLFDRSKRSIFLTEAGISLLPKAKAVVCEMEKIQYFLQNYQPRQTGITQLRIGIEDHLMRITTLRRNYTYVEEELLRKEPHIATEIMSLNFYDLKKLLRSDELDVGLFTTHDLKMADPFNYSIAYTSPLYVYYSPKMENLGNVEDLSTFISSHTIVHIDDNPHMRNHMYQLYKQLDVAPKEIVAHDLYFALTRAARGEGILILPEIVMKEYASDTFASIPLPDDAPQSYYIVAWTNSNPAVEFFYRNFFNILNESDS